MPKPKYCVSKAILNTLKWKLEEELTFRLLSKLDCKKASVVIFNQTGKTLSESTLYRMFLYDKNASVPFLQSLETLASFVGFTNWAELESHLTEINYFRIKSGIFSENAENEPHSLLYHCIQSTSFEVLKSYFEQFPFDLSFDKKIILGEEIYATLYRNPESTMSFYREFHNVPIVRESFFEFFADPQFKLDHYEEGMELYLQNIDPKDSVQSLQDYVFANSLLLRHYFFSGQLNKLETLGKRLYVDFDVKEDELGKIHVYPLIRYRTYYLLYCFHSKGFDEIYWEWLINFAKDLSVGKTKWDQKIIVHTVLDALQFNEEYLAKTYELFQEYFIEIFNLIPPHINQKPIPQRLRYFDTNSAQIYD